MMERTMPETIGEKKETLKRERRETAEAALADWLR
jgi:hypothetical protein